MADKRFAEQAEALFQGMNAFISTKTVVGAPQHRWWMSPAAWRPVPSRIRREAVTGTVQAA